MKTALFSLIIAAGIAAPAFADERPTATSTNTLHVADQYISQDDTRNAKASNKVIANMNSDASSRGRGSVSDSSNVLDVATQSIYQTGHGRGGRLEASNVVKADMDSRAKALRGGDALSGNEAVVGSQQIDQDMAEIRHGRGTTTAENKVKVDMNSDAVAGKGGFSPRRILR